MDMIIAKIYEILKDSANLLSVVSTFCQGVSLFFMYLPPFLPHLGLVPPSIGERSLITHLLKDLNFAQKYFTHTVKRKKFLEAREKALTLRGNGNPASNAQKRHKSEIE